jgi:hypothetical protein
VLIIVDVVAAVSLVTVIDVTATVPVAANPKLPIKKTAVSVGWFSA